MKTVRINRAKWANGDNSRFSRLCINLNQSNESRCCLGFAVNQLCKIPYKNLELEYKPSSLTYSDDFANRSKYFQILLELEDDAIKLNDNRTINNKKREKSLIALFKKHNIKLEFYGEEREPLPLIWSL